MYCWSTWNYLAYCKESILVSLLQGILKPRTLFKSIQTIKLVSILAGSALVQFIRYLCHAGVSSDRTNLSPFTKDYRGLALKCD